MSVGYDIQSCACFWKVVLLPFTKVLRLILKLGWGVMVLLLLFSIDSQVFQPQLAFLQTIPHFKKKKIVFHLACPYVLAVHQLA